MATEYAGRYECRAVNEAGHAADHVDVRLAQPPVVVVSQSRELFARGEPIVVQCRATAGGTKLRY
jgi:hypothetical protein